MKICACGCGREITRKLHWNDYNWNQVKFFSPQCKMKMVNARHKHKKTGQARIRRLRDKNYEPSVPANHPLLKIRF